MDKSQTDSVSRSPDAAFSFRESRVVRSLNIVKSAIQDNILKSIAALALAAVFGTVVYIWDYVEREIDFVISGYIHDKVIDRLENAVGMSVIDNFNLGGRGESLTDERVVPIFVPQGHQVDLVFETVPLSSMPPGHPIELVINNLIDSSITIPVRARDRHSLTEYIDQARSARNNQIASTLAGQAELFNDLFTLHFRLPPDSWGGRAYVRVWVVVFSPVFLR